MIAQNVCIDTWYFVGVYLSSIGMLLHFKNVRRMSQVAINKKPQTVHGKGFFLICSYECLEQH